jgi:hypothetical protein
MTENTQLQKPKSTYVSKKKKFQNDPNDPDIILVPKEQIPVEKSVITLDAEKIKKKINLTDEQREKRKQQGIKLGEMSTLRAKVKREQKEQEAKSAKEIELAKKEEDLKKMQEEINQKIADGKLVRVKVKPKLTRQKKVPIVPPTDSNRIQVETETEDDTDHEETRKKQRAKRKEAVKIVETLKTIDETIQKVSKGKYFDQLSASFG